MPAGNRNAIPPSSRPQPIHFTDWPVVGLWFDVGPTFMINSSRTQTTYYKKHSVPDDSWLHGWRRGVFCVWVVPADVEFMPRFRRPSPFCLFFVWSSMDNFMVLLLWHLLIGRWGTPRESYSTSVSLNLQCETVGKEEEKRSGRVCG